MTIIYYILVLGITIFVHELGHFIFAKKAGIYVYEFSLGMGPTLYSFKRKNDETKYSLRLFPIGGYVKMAGEEVELDEKIPKEKRLQSKTWKQKAFVVLAGIAFNFLLAVLLFFLVALITGIPKNNATIVEIDKNFPIVETNIKVGDKIVEINGGISNTLDMFQLQYSINYGQELNIKVKHTDGTYENITLTPTKIEEEYYYGFYLDNTNTKNFFQALGYGFVKTGMILQQMVYIIWYLIIGKLSLNALSGPVGVYNIVGESAKDGVISIINLMAYICVNVGFINLLPIPAFDGGRFLFMIIEKIRRKPVPIKVENTIHVIGLVLLMILMVVITWNDIVKFIIK